MYSYYLDGIRIFSSGLTDLRCYLLNSLVNPRKSKLIITFNLEFYRNATINKDFYSVCRNAELVIPDGVSIIHLIKLKYNKWLKRITGNDLFELILSISDEHPLKIAFVGSTSKVIKMLTDKVTKDHPGCSIVAAISPSLNFELNEEENNKVLQQLVSSQPDILLLALGNPRQELWLNKHKDQIGSKLNVGVGAVFDFYTGFKRRSPMLLQRLSLEWAWRVLQEPRRLSKRYIVHGIPFFIKKTFQIMLKKEINA
ncbi:MAG: WecB/TagA/CpsF family glycosyltransferase [Ignavibacteriaceae bacterium]|nr:WecB/TagA/CpsF family glycosyltransferase [Ignavibacteriaceae bacterium]